MKLIDINDRQREAEEVTLDPRYPGFVTVKYKTNRAPDTFYVEWYPIGDFSDKNPELAKLLGNPAPPPKSDLGICTHSGEFYLEDTSKSWRDNIFTSYMVWISRGTGEGQVRLVKSNSKNNLTIDQPWTILPDTTSQYVVSLDIHDVKILDNKLPQNV